MKHARRQDLQQWLRSKPKPSMVEGLGLFCALMAVLVPGLAAAVGVTRKYQPLSEGAWVLLVAGAAVILLLSWNYCRRLFEKRDTADPRRAALGKRFRLGHLMVLVAEAFGFGWFLRDGGFEWSGGLAPICGSVYGLMALQAGYVLVGLLVARKVQTIAERDEWPDARAYVAVALYAPLVVPPVLAFGVFFVLHGEVAIPMTLLAATLGFPVLWILYLFGSKGLRLIERNRKARWRAGLRRVAAGKVRPARTPAAKRAPGMHAPRPPAAGFSGPMDGCGRQIP